MVTRFRQEVEGTLWWVVGAAEEWLELPDYMKAYYDGGPGEAGMTELKGWNGEPVCYDCARELVYNHRLGWRLRPAGVGRCGRCRRGVGG
jgi:hypothetical protein